LYVTFLQQATLAPILLTAILMQEVVTIHEKFLKSMPASHPG